jgi:alginate O-acetyltransferase complex protein AlgI
VTDFHLYHFITLVVLAIMSWKLPRQWQMDGVSLFSNVFICWFSPVAAACLLTCTTIVYLISLSKVRSNLWILAAVVYCTIQFLLIRYLQMYGQGGYFQSLSVLGIAYFTCRHIHYLIEVSKGNIIINLRQFWYYQSFLPVMVTGPINRYPEFIHELQRRRWDSTQVSIGIERVVYGYATVIIIGNYLIADKMASQISLFKANPMIYQWLESLQNWAYLYAQFSGWSSIAIGFSLIMGIRISENFNSPLLATSLIEFWQRWHISLSYWCKDYVFAPTIALTRQPFLAVIVATISMGIWHELSTYYLIWGIYHAIGISGCRIFQKYSATLEFMPKFRGWRFIAWFLTMNYIICGQPIISTIDRWIHLYV